MIMAYRGILTNRAKTISPETVLSQCHANEGIFLPAVVKNKDAAFFAWIIRFVDHAFLLISSKTKSRFRINFFNLYLRLDLNGARSLL